MNTENSTRLADIIPLRDQFVRSSRIDDAPDQGQKLIYSNTIDQFLVTLARHQQSDMPQGAFTWTGPYGSGKSTLAQSLLSFLVTAKSDRLAATANYYDSTRELLESVFFKNVDEWTSVPIVGTNSPFEIALKNSLVALGVLSKKDNPTSEMFVSAIERFLEVGDTRRGLILIVDEMGKFLEYAVSNDSDVYLYQLLAEAAARSGGRFVFVGILHQSIQEYAATAIKRIRDEWSKVQGRFADVGLNLNSTEQIELISNAINCEVFPAHQATLAERFVKHLAVSKRLPGENLAEGLMRCWPLNPLTTYILGPVSKRSYGQNQRSIFSFLSSNEPLGFRAYLDTHNISSVPKCGFSLPDLWDYLSLNWRGLISASQDSHSFSIARETLDQLDAKLSSLKNFAQLAGAIKTIHLLELTRHETGLTANAETLAISLGISKSQARLVIETLASANIVAVRSHNGSVFLHEGSDFSIDDALSEELEKQTSIDYERLSQEFLGATIFAKRHYLETGSMRWADLELVDLELNTSPVDDFIPNSEHFARFVVNVGVNADAFAEHVHESKYRRHFAVTDLQLTEIERDTIREFTALIRISEQRAELSKDKIARREVNDRIDLRRQQIGSLVEGKLADAIWDIPALNVEISSESLAQIASKIADDLFDLTPIVQNELVNRKKVSSNASRATKLFLYDLIAREGEENLGYKSFPAERAIFETVLKVQGLYADIGGRWLLQNPRDVQGEKAGRLSRLFEQTLNYLKVRKDRAVGLIEIYENIWSRPPYGVKSGLFPIYSYLFIRSFSSELVYYQDGVFAPELTEVDVDYFLRSPKYCSLRYLDYDEKTQNLLASLAEISDHLGFGVPDTSAPLDVARSLIAIFDSVPAWTKKTAKISHDAKLVRSLFARAMDPAQFTLIDIPNLFGEIDHRNQDAVKASLQKVENGLAELLSFQASVLESLREHLFKELGIKSVTKETVRELNDRATNVRKMAGDNRMETFITNLMALTLDQISMEKLAGMLVNKPTKIWIDNDVDRLFVEATNYARNFNTLETMGHIKGRESSRKALSLIFHNSGSGEVKKTNIELSPEEAREANRLSERMRMMLKEEKYSVGPREMIAALALLLEKEELDV